MLTKDELEPVLPDGIFAYQISQIWYILYDLGMGIFCISMPIWYSLLQFGIVCDHLVYFPCFAIKNLATLLGAVMMRWRPRFDDEN
jgi:hypothetical protein